MSKEEYSFIHKLDIIAFSLIVYVAISVTGITLKKTFKDE